MKQIALLLLLTLLPTAVLADSNNPVPYREKITVSVGDSVVIHGLRGGCGELPSKAAIANMETNYAQLKLGKIVAGRKGVRNSRSCGGATPVVEAIFVAEKPGRMKLEIFGDPVSIRVKK